MSESRTWEDVCKKALIDVLKTAPQGQEELKNALKSALKKTKSDDAIRHRLTRYMNELEYLDLVKERDGKYYWYFYINIFDEYYPAKLGHARLLIPALGELAGFATPPYSIQPLQERYASLDDMKILKSCAETHLKAYPEIWGLLEDCRKIMENVNSRREEFMYGLKIKLEKEFGELMDPNQGLRLQSFVGSNIPSSIFSHMRYYSQISYDKKKDGKVLWLDGSIMVAKGEDVLLSKVSAFIEHELKEEQNIQVVRAIEGIERTYLDTQRELQSEIRKLILKIESGEPLKAQCEICPQVFRKKTKPAKKRSEEKI